MTATSDLAIVVRQPWATLIMTGAKTIETRPWPPNGPMRPDGVRGLPGCRVERGQRLWIVAGAQAPTTGEDVGDWYWENTYADPECIIRSGGGWEEHPAPLGVVLGSVVIDEALPVLGPNPDDRDWVAADTLGRDLTVGSPGFLSLDVWPDEGSGGKRTNMADQLPLGDFTPGRWGWLLSSPLPLSSPVPCKGRQGVFRLPPEVAEQVQT